MSGVIHLFEQRAHKLQPGDLAVWIFDERPKRRPEITHDLVLSVQLKRITGNDIVVIGVITAFGRIDELSMSVDDCVPSIFRMSDT